MNIFEDLNKQLQQFLEDDEKLKLEDFSVIKGEDGFYKVSPYDARIGYIQPSKDIYSVRNNLLKAINKYNSKQIREERKKLILKLHNLFKQHEIPKMKDMTSAIRGYRPIVKAGYKIETMNGLDDEFDIIVVSSGECEEIMQKIKTILDDESIVYSQANNYFHINMNKQK